MLRMISTLAMRRTSRVWLSLAPSLTGGISVVGNPVRWAASEPDGGSATTSAELKSIVPTARAAAAFCPFKIVSLH
ncbi:MAG: hypothetical protein ACLPX1_00010 [Steroidobacteraceae bacterium]